MGTYIMFTNNQKKINMFNVYNTTRVSIPHELFDKAATESAPFLFFVQEAVSFASLHLKGSSSAGLYRVNKYLVHYYFTNRHGLKRHIGCFYIIIRVGILLLQKSFDVWTSQMRRKRKF